MIIRDMTMDDIEEVAGWEQKIFSDFWTAKSFEESLTHEHAWLIVAQEEDGAISGYASIYHAMDEGELENIAVIPNYRRQGIADALLAHIADGLKAMGVHYLYLEVRESNVPAQKLYEKHGFVFSGLRKNFYEHPREHAWVMVREL